MTIQTSNNWVADIERKMRRFSRTYGPVYSKTKRQLFAYFEIGCFLTIADYYSTTGRKLNKENLIDGKYKFLTTPNGDPDNFSYLTSDSGTQPIDLRQQVRVISHIDNDIAFTPDILVLKKGSAISSRNDIDYAGGKRKFFHVNPYDVIAAHECKSLQPFPELFIGFIGSFIAGHIWHTKDDIWSFITKDKNSTNSHPAPTLFVGGSTRALHSRMIDALQRSYPINIVTGLHSGISTLKSNITNFVRHEVIDS